jgi:Arc/MetJ-type ribon-helix-helix transcriptional regulator
MMIYHTTSKSGGMPKTKVAVTISSEILQEIDVLVAGGQFPNRSQAVEAALAEKLERLSHGRLARETAKVDPREEKSLAEEGMGAELAAWPEY